MDPLRDDPRLTTGTLSLALTSNPRRTRVDRDPRCALGSSQRIYLGTGSRARLAGTSLGAASLSLWGITRLTVLLPQETQQRGVTRESDL